LTYAAQAIIWVIVGGRGTLLGPIFGSFGIFWLTSWLGTQSYFNSNMVLGLILILFVLLLPRGVVPAVAVLATRLSRRKKGGRRDQMRSRRRGRGVMRPAE
jgi:branched-chain amino acid transport system permease protein